MGAFQFTYRTRLYRKAVWAVICAFALAGCVPLFAQFAKKRQVSKGPRAVGLLELAANGKAHLIPVTIMIDGKFYDAGAYKADPVPMALQSETVYEALKSGVSEGLFTVSGAMPENSGWIADGRWRDETEIKADRDRAKAEAARKAYKAPEDVGGPPKLKRAPQSSDQSSPPTAQTTSPTPQPTPPAPGAIPPTTPKNPPAVPDKGSSTTSSYTPQASDNAPDRPLLRRRPATEAASAPAKPEDTHEALKGPIQLIPAVSDTDGAEPRPYTYELKPEEEQKFLKTMSAMATDEVRARALKLLAETEPAAKSARKTARPTINPELQNVQMHVFDLTSSNEPVLVLTATATVPNARVQLQYTTAVVAREDIYGELHKVFAQTTDDQHLDVIPKFEFIDAVDADGDGRGELLFRTTQDSGTAFNIYAVIGDRLWPLFEGKPGS
ncbi:MAG TPA: hypothetical protein VHV29_08545 [Terriglobales bacterium]|jgi:hypothetical protein|nr:hypothetical protein [Terriglobales bacterium]